MPTQTNDDLPALPPAPDTGRTELERDLFPALDDDTQRELHALAIHDVRDALNDRIEWEDRLAVGDQQYYGLLGDKNFPWPGASNLHVPLTMTHVETLKPRLVESVLGGDPMILAVPTESADVERAARTEQFLNWQARTELNIDALVPTAAHLFCLPGTVIGKTCWRVIRRRRTFIRTFPQATPLQEILEIVLDRKVPTKLTSTGSTSWTGELPSSAEGGPPLTFTLTLKMDDTEAHVAVERDELTERPEISLVDPINFLVPFNGGGDIDRLPWCAERMYLTTDELYRFVQRGRFTRSAVDALLETRVPRGEDANLDSESARTTREEVEGVQSADSDAIADTWEIYQVFRSWDLDNDGFDEEIVYWVSPDLPDLLLGWDSLDNLHAHGRRGYRVGRYMEIPFRFYGLSLPEILRNLQEEINTIHNQRVDAGTLANMPWYLYRASSTHNPARHPIRPGSGIPIDNPQQDVVFPRIQFNETFGQNEEALVYQYAERLTGANDLTLGRQPNRVGATRTATGVASLLSEAGLRFKTAMLAFQRFWVGIFEDVLALDQQYLPPGKEFRVTGRLPEFIRLTSRADIAGKYDLRLSATTETLNKEVMRQDATQLMTLAANPVLLQLGMVGQKGIRKHLEDLYRAYGKDPDLYLETPVDGIVHTPEEELAMFVSGMEVKPSPAENLVLHVQAHMLQARDPLVQMTLGPQGMLRLGRHIQETLQLLQMQVLGQGMGGRGNGAAMPGQGPQSQNALTGAQAPQNPSPSSNLQPTQGEAPTGGPGY